MTQSKAQTTSDESKNSDPVLEAKERRRELAKSPEAWAEYVATLQPVDDALAAMREAAKGHPEP